MAKMSVFSAKIKLENVFFDSFLFKTTTTTPPQCVGNQMILVKPLQHSSKTVFKVSCPCFQ